MKKNDLILKIDFLKKSSIKSLIEQRISEFEKIKSPDKIFSELCFCLLTANFKADKSIEMQNNLSKDFLYSNEQKLALELKEYGHRFWEQRAKRIILARNKKKDLIKLLKLEKNEQILRNWIVKNIQGLGLKEASHFLRNIGYKNLAIIDFHIINILVKYNLISELKSLTPRKYLEIENILKEISLKTKLDLARLDLYLWYMETGKVLK
ncbi:MAG: N-glycosylase/DNA lyase [Candidatus Nanoarchaeia archaeon]|jgi:N-glycosylase/DNA lyase|nr:N-glycosylase/DNA lyase [Candidatus Nanoarchaeia archaeon]MDD4563267.1 N-glycosylase/DNA lyase [Candidatus Nanoarchaeia archaeon]